MNWFAQNKFLSGFLAVLVLAIGGAGYYLSTTHGKYRDAMDTFEQERSVLGSLERKQLYPSQENVDVIEEEVERYQEKVVALQEQLLKFQKPLDTSIADTQFPNVLKDRIQEFQALAASRKVKLPEEFYMGFEAYSSSFPRPPAVSLLNFQVQAIEAMLTKLVGAQVDEIIALEREPLEIESNNYQAPDPAPPLEKYPVELTISGNHEAIREFFNQLSNDTEYFYIIRFIRIENSAKEGPMKGAGPGGGGGGGGGGAFGLDDPGMPQPDAGGMPQPPAFQDFGFPADSDMAAGQGEGQPAAVNYDAQIVMGKEKIQVYMVIDVVRFVEIEAVESK